MEADISVKFTKIKGLKVDSKLIKKVPMLVKSTEKTVKKLCREIEAYFNKYHIKTKVNFIMK